MKTVDSAVRSVFDRITWLGNAGLLIEGERAVYIDPYRLAPGLPRADLILLTHPHFDHLSIKDIRAVATPETLVAGPADCLEGLGLPVERLEPGQTKRLRDVRVSGIPAYNHKKPYHPKAKGWLGYVVEIDGARIYHAGDTEEIPEMDGLNPDVACLPSDNQYTMDSFMAGKSAKRTGARIAMPVHYGCVSGRKSDAARFIQFCAELGVEASFPARERLDAAAPALPELAPERELVL